MTTTKAHVESVFELLREWQRGAITWEVVIYRADVTRLGAAKLATVTRMTASDAVARLAREAVAAGY